MSRLDCDDAPDTLWEGVERERKMADRRNLIGAAGIAIFALGLGALLSYLVARGAQNRPFQWASVAVISLTVMAIGLALMVGVLWLFHALHKHRLKLDEFVDRGVDLLLTLMSSDSSHET